MLGLDKLINELYQNKLSESECKEATRNLVGFFLELAKIETRLQREQLIQKESNNKVKCHDKNNKSSN